MGSSFHRFLVAAAAVVVACVDGPTSPGRFGELRIRPSYAVGDEPAAIGIEVDSARVRVARSGTPGTALIDTTLAYDSDTTSMGWLLELTADEESVRIEMELRDGGTRVYAGERDAMVRDGALAAATIEPVAVAYVGPPVVASVAVSPATLAWDALGDTATLAAEARDRHGNVVAATFVWSTEDATVATVDPASGLVTAIANGTSTVRATVGTLSGTATVAVAQRVDTIEVTPARITLTSIGATQAMAAAARDRNGHAIEDLTVTWTSDHPAVATVSAASTGATGVVTAVAGGSALIIAAAGDVDASVLVTVDPPGSVASVVVTPGSVTLTAVGATQQFTAVARDAGGRVVEGVSFTWTTGDADVVSLDPRTGIASAVGHGVSSVTATAGSVVGSASVTVDLSPNVASVEVVPAAATLTSVGATRQFVAVARDAAGVALPGVPITWSSSATEVATVDPSSGLATAVAHGAATVRASAGSATGTATLAVDLAPTIASVEVSPDPAILNAIGAVQQFTAVARNAAGVVVPVALFAWSSSEPTVALIGASSGVATAWGGGGTTIRATVGPVAGAATLTVELTSSVASIVVTPADVRLTGIGATQAFTAVARDGAGVILPGVSFTWSSSSPDVAAVDASTGIAVAVAHGATSIRASANGVSGSAALTVDLVESVATIVVAPAEGTTLTAVGATQQFTAVARDAQGAVVPVARFEWSSGAPAVAAVDPGTGLATAAGHGSTTVSATVGGVTGTASLAVDLTGHVASIAITPALAELTSLGVTRQYSAEARDAAGNLLPGIIFAWSSTAPAIAAIDAATGIATALANGSTLISASAGGVTATATLTIAQRVVRVIVAPDSVTLISGTDVQQFTARAVDANGRDVQGVSFVWSSSDESVALAHETGLTYAKGVGTAIIRATTAGISGTAIVVVVP